MARAAFAIQTLSLLVGLAAFGATAQAETGDSGISGDLSARDVRMQTRTSWDYQPGQGPKRTVHDRDYFYPASSPSATAPLTPPPEVQPGDWRNPPPSEDKLPKEMPSFETKTTQSVELGVQSSFYHYHEDTPSFLKTQGPLFGLTAAYTGPVSDKVFVRVEGRFAGGMPAYKRLDEKKDTPNYVGELRATVGADLLRSHWGLSPYVGLGYRYLRSNYNEIHGDNLAGYSRDGHYLFAPIGVEPRLRLPSGHILSLKAEFDPLLQGWQKTYYTDLSPTLPDLTMRQKSGYGLRGELNYKTPRWAFGPFVNYWNVEQSETTCGMGPGHFACTERPHNHTLEYGLNIRYLFH